MLTIIHLISKAKIIIISDSILQLSLIAAMSNFSTFFKSFSILLYFMSHSVSSLPSNKFWNESSACLLNCTLSYMKMWLEVMQHDAVEKLEAVDAEHICRKFLKYSACVKVCNSPNSPFLKFEDFEKNCKDVNNGILTNLTCIRKNSANVRRMCMKEENNLLKAVDKTLLQATKALWVSNVADKGPFCKYDTRYCKSSIFYNKSFIILKICLKFSLIYITSSVNTKKYIFSKKINCHAAMIQVNCSFTNLHNECPDQEIYILLQLIQSQLKSTVNKNCKECEKLDQFIKELIHTIQPEAENSDSDNSKAKPNMRSVYANETLEGESDLSISNRSSTDQKHSEKLNSNSSSTLSTSTSVFLIVLTYLMKRLF
ncbi:hypothetical protein T02_13502 [Trichinella nativa]|uniref:Chondroitin proteoglycan 4 domain-containing protein n=1 Tax=Trichinella nativa TaxID=6335 RepID=A0A0V1L1K4_9BILA|nr:hypothetical protein T02_13502 [Trichinella nativa]